MSERREANRRRVYIGGRIVHRHLRSDTACLIRNLSTTGARLVVGATIPLPDHFDIVVDSRGTTQPVESVWRDGDAIGVRFRDDTAEPIAFGRLSTDLPCDGASRGSAA